MTHLKIRFVMTSALVSAIGALSCDEVSCAETRTCANSFHIDGGNSAAGASSDYGGTAGEPADRNAGGVSTQTGGTESGGAGAAGGIANGGTNEGGASNAGALSGGAAEAGSGGIGGGAGEAGSGGIGGGAGEAGSGGIGGARTEGFAGDGGVPSLPGCAPGSEMCKGDIAFVCDAEGEWQSEQSCQGPTENCGNCKFGEPCTVDADCAGPNHSCEETCGCVGYTFPKSCGGCGSWNFESGTVEGWVEDTSPHFPVEGGVNNGVTNILNTETRVHDGDHALAVPGNVNSEVISVAIPICETGAAINLGGYTMSAWVYLTGTELVYESFLFMDAWGPSTSTSGPVLTGSNIVNMDTWHRVELTFTDSVQATHVAIRFNPNLSWTGTMYLDTVEITAP